MALTDHYQTSDNVYFNSFAFFKHAIGDIFHEFYYTSIHWDNFESNLDTKNPNKKKRNNYILFNNNGLDFSTIQERIKLVNDYIPKNILCGTLNYNLRTHKSDDLDVKTIGWVNPYSLNLHNGTLITFEAKPKVLSDKLLRMSRTVDVKGEKKKYSTLQISLKFWYLGLPENINIDSFYVKEGGANQKLLTKREGDAPFMAPDDRASIPLVFAGTYYFKRVYEGKTII